MRAGSFKEWQVSLILIIIEAAFCLVAFLITPLI
jgi:hypothetical protein